MSPVLQNAMRKKAFVQGYIRAIAMMRGFSSVGAMADVEILALLPVADAAFVVYRAERELPTSDEVTP